MNALDHWTESVSTLVLEEAARCAAKAELYVPLAVRAWAAADVLTARGLLRRLGHPGAGEYRITDLGQTFLNRWVRS